MANCTRATGKVTIGLDLGDKYSYLYSLDTEGEFLEEGRLRTTEDALRKRFEGKAPARVAIETGTHSPWVYRVLESLGHEVLVANARQLPLISENNKKTDRTDAKTLAEVAHARPQLLRPIQPRPLDSQVVLARIRARQSLVDTRTKLVNHVRGAVKSIGARLPACSTRRFHESAAEHLPEELKAILAPHLKMIEKLSAEIASHGKVVEKVCEKRYPQTDILMQVSGVGALTALAFMHVLVDPRRFKDSRAVGAYLGLTPRRSDSGEQEPQLRITKAGDGLLRRLLVGSAHYILGPFGPDSDLRRYGLEHSRQGGKNGKRRAVVAVARKLAVLLHRLWLTGEVYEPLRNAQRKERRREARVAKLASGVTS